MQRGKYKSIRKFYFVLLIIAMGVIALKMQAFVRVEAEEKEIPVLIPEKPKYNPVVEIQNTLEKFDSCLQQNINESGTVGAAVVVTYKGQIALLKCFGVRKAGEKDPVNENTVFRLASVSKPVTGVLAGVLDDQKVIDLDDKVVEYLPELELKTKESTKQLEVRHLLSHTSGLIPHAYDLMVEDHVPLNKILERLDEVDITAEPGKLYGYQNVIYSIYDPLVKQKTDKSFSEVLQEKVFDPIGMNDASVGYEAFKNNMNKAYPHYNSGKSRFRAMRLNDRYYNTAPAAGINASISDLGNFLVALDKDHNEYLSDSAYQKIFEPQVSSLLKRGYFRSWGRDVKSKRYSIGWRIVDYKGREIAYHGGYVLGYKAEIAFCDAEDVGIAILSNSPNSTTAKNIPNFLNMLFQDKDQMAMQQGKETSAGDKS